MASDYGFGETENELVELCRDYPPDWEQIRAVLARGVDLNAISADTPEKNMLAQIIYGYPQVLEMREIFCDRCVTDDCDGCDFNYPQADGRYLPQLIALFLENGFDVHKDEGRFGATCLVTLIWSSDDSYILEAARLLLQAGARADITPWNDGWERETVDQIVLAERSAALHTDNDPAKAELMQELYALMAAPSTA